MRLFRDRGRGALRFQHPDWNLQSPPTWVQNANGPVTSLWSAKDLLGGTMERVKWIEDPNTRFIRAQGIVGVGVITRIFIFSFLAEASHPMEKAGSPADQGSSFRSGCCRGCSGADSCTTSNRPSELAS